MNRKNYQQMLITVTFFVVLLLSIAIARNSYLLAITAVLTGMIFMLLVRAKVKIKTDERERTIQEKAARMTYAIFTSTITMAAFLLLLPSKGGLAAFSKGEWLFLESLGMVFAYLTSFLLVIYAISYHFFNRRFGGSGNEE